MGLKGTVRSINAAHRSLDSAGPAVALGLNLIILSANLKPLGIRQH